jgi:hypothetical protein
MYGAVFHDTKALGDSGKPCRKIITANDIRSDRAVKRTITKLIWALWAAIDETNLHASILEENVRISLFRD